MHKRPAWREMTMEWQPSCWIHQLSDTEAFAADDFVATIEVLFDFGKTGDPLPEFEGLPIPLRQRLLISPIDMYPVKKL